MNFAADSFHRELVYLKMQKSGQNLHCKITKNVLFKLYRIVRELKVYKANSMNLDEPLHLNLCS